MLVQQDHFMWFHYEPVSVGRTRFRMATVVPKDAPDTEEMRTHWKRNHVISVTALKEDFELGEEVQSGFASRGNPSHLFGRFEGALNRFNLAVEEMLST
jgi:phenylpropionate dioxygenase-like ring-hydroxylating dioxygenase large terminal subunit